MTDNTEVHTRVVAPELDSILGIPMKVLDEGFVRVIDYMGSDESIVQAARVSYGRGTKRVHEDRGLIRYLMRHRHTTPFEMCEIKLHVRVPMDTWRQWIRHRTASVNEYSTRYSVAIDAAQRTPPSGWRSQSREGRQGSAEHIAVDLGTGLSDDESQLHRDARRVYENRLEQGVAREQARKDLPLSTYTEAYWKIDLHNLLHFLSLRMDERAQFEIREYANVIGKDILARWCPVTWLAFTDYRRKAVTLSRPELDVIAALVRGSAIDAMAAARQHGLLPAAADRPLKRNRERIELEAKLASLGLPIPWKADDNQ